MNLDVDPYSFPTIRDPGRGDLVLEKNGDSVSLEYHLPEYPDDIEQSIRSVIGADKQVRDRSVTGKDPTIVEI